MKGPAWLRDPVAPSLVLFGGLVTGGFVALRIGWSVAARTLFVPYQIPALVSGAMGGLAVIAIGAVLAGIQVGRRSDAIARVEDDTLLDEVSALVELMIRKRSR